MNLKLNALIGILLLVSTFSAVVSADEAEPQVTPVPAHPAPAHSVKPSPKGKVPGKCPKSHKCSPNQDCVLIQVQCVAAPCPPLPMCVDRD